MKSSWTARPGFGKLRTLTIQAEGDGNGFFSYENGTWLIDLIDFNENGENNAREHLFNVYKKVHRLMAWTPFEWTQWPI
jgi:hypothetical protein